MVKKDDSYLFYVIKDVGGHRARGERIFESLIVLEVCQITTVIYMQVRNNRLKIKSNVRQFKKEAMNERRDST